MAAHNASLYNIPHHKLVFVQADTLHVMDKCYADGRLAIPKRQACQGPSTLFERCCGFLIGGLELLPDNIDVIFMDPPWGGVQYESLGKNGYDLVKNMKIPYGGGEYGEAQVEDHAHEQSQLQQNDESTCNHDKNTEKRYVNGADLLRMAAAATSSRLVMYDIPRNTNRTSLGQAALAAGYRGNIKLEEHYLNMRLKTVTAYLGCDYSLLVK
mmetsp:Transcript_23931/g.27312  ORF Transcript_23931/g.27312 Transcript_23931/m.27312 type:complete len:212 (-) Transcript_23931:37-672(-)